MGIKLVIVDDAPFIREILRHIFAQTTNIEIIGEAQDGNEALEIVRRLNPDVILMDIVMPVMSGIEATEKIMQEFPQMKVIACSTVDQSTMMMRALEAGCCHYITKPFNGAEVVKAVTQAVDQNTQEARQ